MIDDHRRRAELFRDLHAGPDVLVLANPWDIGSARMLEHAGFRALATTSAGLAFTLGRRDGTGAVSGENQFEGALVPERDCKLAVQMSDEFFTIFFVEMNDGFSV